MREAPSLSNLALVEGTEGMWPRPEAAPTCMPLDTGDHCTNGRMPAPRRNGRARYDDNGNGRITRKEVRRHCISTVRRDHPAYRYMRDGDGDGIVYE